MHIYMLNVAIFRHIPFFFIFQSNHFLHTNCSSISLPSYHPPNLKPLHPILREGEAPPMWHNKVCHIIHMRQDQDPPSCI